MSEAGAGVGDGRGHARASAPGSDPVARLVFALLVIACFAAFLIAQRLKHTPTAVQSFEMNTAFSPYPAGHIKQEGISFKLAQADEVTVTIIDSDGNTVATLVRGRPVARYKRFSLRWNGHRGTAHSYSTLKTPRGLTILVPDNEGRLAPPGEYRVWVSLRHQDRTVPAPRSFTLLSP